MSAEEFYELTPRQFAAMRRQWFTREKEFHRAICALRVDVINHSLGRPEKPVTIEMLMPGRESVERMTKKRRAFVANRLRATMGSLAGGLIVRNAAGEILESVPSEP